MIVETDSVRCTPIGLIYNCYTPEDSGFLYLSKTIIHKKRINIFIGKEYRIIPTNSLFFQKSCIVQFIMMIWCFMVMKVFFEKLWILF